MKVFKRNIYAGILTGMSLLATGCTDSLDTVPQGSQLTQGTLDENTAKNPSSISGLVNGMYANMIEAEAITSWAGSTYHFDYGYASTMLMYDCSGQDVVSNNSGYNWYRNNLRFTDRTEKSSATYFIWNQQYKNIKQANDILKAIDENTTDGTLKAARGQAYAMRAFCYFNLAQAYQFTYKGHEEAPCVPIVTETTSGEAGNNNPRATVKAVYELMQSDLAKAIELTEGSSRSSKGSIDQSVAYGLRARVNLVMQNWKQAADDAAKAAEGYTPLSISEAATPGFNDINAGNWIWGMDVNETNDIVSSGILNFPSMMSSFTGNGYSPMYAPKSINSKLWKTIPSTDVRKGWWLDENLKSPIVDMSKVQYVTDENTAYVAVFNKNGEEVIDWDVPYLNVKFGAYQNIYGNETNACDVPLMRVEEMYLIEAEAKAMSGDVTGGKEVLEQFVKTYRDPAYTCSATTAEGVQESVWQQRRIELWGEGFSFFDLARLKKPVDRTGSNFEETVSYNIPAESKILLWIIPEDEENNNRALKGHNNEIVAPPTASAQ